MSIRVKFQKIYVWGGSASLIKVTVYIPAMPLLIQVNFVGFFDRYIEEKLKFQAMGDEQGK